MKAYVIYLPDREHSVQHSDYMIEKLTEYGFDAAKFEGTNGNDTTRIFAKEHRTLYPYSIKSKVLNQVEIATLLKPGLPNDFFETHDITITEKFKWNEKEVGKINTPGVRGCFHSHFRLWKQCIDLQEPIAIFEDDVKFFRGYQPVEFTDVLIVSLGKNSFYNEPFKSFLENPQGEPKAIPWKNFSMPGASGYMITPNAASNLVKFYRNYFAPADSGMNKNIVHMDIHTHIMGRNTLPEEGNVSMTRSKDWDKE